MMEMLTIRTATPADAPLLPAVEKSAGEAFRALPDLAWIASDDVASVDSYLPLIAAGTVWVAEEGGRIVGVNQCEVLDDELHVWELAVAMGFQQRGIGRALLDAAAAFAR